MWWSLLLVAQLGAALDPPSGEGSLGPNFSRDGGEVLLTWIEGDRVRFSRLKGDRWSAPIDVVRSAQLFSNWADFPSASARKGEVLVHFLEKSGAGKYAYDVELARANDGARFERLGEAHDDRTETEHGFVSILSASDGFRLFWLDGREMAKSEHGPMTLRTARLIGGKIASTEILDPRTCECCSTDAAMTREGPFVVYRDRSEEELRNIAIVRWSRGGWSEPVDLHDDGWKVTGCPVNGPAADADRARAAVAWYTGADLGRVRVAFSSDSAKTFTKPIELHDDPDAAPLGRVDVALVKGGAVVTWVVADDEQRARILMRRVSEKGAVGPPITVAETSPSRGSGFPRLVHQRGSLLLAFTEVGPPSRIRVRRIPLRELRAAPQAVLQPRAKAPPYRARTLAGAEVSLADLRGKVVLLNLWATWCGPCRREIPLLAQLHQKYQAKGLVVVGINVDEPGADERVRSLVERLSIPYAVWRDPEDQASRIFGASALPMSVVLDRSGKVAFTRAGEITAEDPELLRMLD